MLLVDLIDDDRSMSTDGVAEIAPDTLSDGFLCVCISAVTFFNPFVISRPKYISFAKYNYIFKLTFAQIRK